MKTDSQATHNTCKRALVINDLCGFGHTSLMAFIPILYRLGIRVCAFPAAVLSVNTDYPDPHWVDMSPHLPDFARHWQEVGLDFEAICSGFLSSPDQVLLVGEAIDLLRGKDSLVLVDPVLGDGGSLYGCYGPEMVESMRELVRRADLITPNFTEAALLAGEAADARADEGVILDWCRRISLNGPRHIVLTSVPGSRPGMLEVQYYCASRDNLVRYPYIRSGGIHPGAGDCFTALLMAGMVNGFSIESSVRASVEIMTLAIEAGIPSNADPREGIDLERMLQWDLASHYQP